MVHIYNGLLLNHKKNEILTFVTTQINLEGIILSEISQTKTNTICFYLYVESKKQNKLTNKKIILFRELMGYYEKMR